MMSPASSIPAAPTKTSAPRSLLGLAALLCIAIQLPGSLLLSGIALAFWLGLVFFFDRPALKRMWLPRFWIITLLFAIGSGLLLGPKSGAGFWSIFSRAGLIAGVQMLVRGAFIFGLAIWASRTWGGKDLQRLTRSIGLPRLGTALATAFELLPQLLDQLRQHRLPATQRTLRGRLLSPGLYGFAVQLISQTARLAHQLAAHGAEYPPFSLPSRPPRQLWAILGEKGSGKTTLITYLAERLHQHHGLLVGGIVQPAETDDQGRRVGYLVRDVMTGEQRPLARRTGSSAEPAPGYEFIDEAWSWARQRILDSRRQHHVLVLDELGRLEARGAGHLPALAAELNGEQARQYLLAVRADCATRLQEHLGPFHRTLAVRSPPELVEAFINELVHARPDNHPLVLTVEEDTP